MSVQIHVVVTQIGVTLLVRGQSKFKCDEALTCLICIRLQGARPWWSFSHISMLTVCEQKLNNHPDNAKNAGYQIIGQLISALFGGGSVKLTYKHVTFTFK